MAAGAALLSAAGEDGARRLHVLAAFEDEADGLPGALRGQVAHAQGLQGRHPVQGLGDGGLFQNGVAGAQAVDCPGHLYRQVLVDVGQLGADDGHLLLHVRVLEVEVGAPPPQGLAEGPGPVGREHHEGDGPGPHHPYLGDGDLHLAEQLQQKGLELLVGLVDLVDEQHHRPLRADGLEQGALQQVLVAEQGLGQRVRVLAVHLHLDAQKLLLIVPLVERLALVQSLVALQAHQFPVQGGGHDLGNLRLAHAGGPLDEQGPAQLQGHQQGGDQAVVADIAGLVQFRPQGSHIHKRHLLC